MYFGLLIGRFYIELLDFYTRLTSLLTHLSPEGIVVEDSEVGCCTKSLSERNGARCRQNGAL